MTNQYIFAFSAFYVFKAPAIFVNDKLSTKVNAMQANAMKQNKNQCKYPYSLNKGRQLQHIFAQKEVLDISIILLTLHLQRNHPAWNDYFT